MNANDLQKLKELAQVTQRAFLKENQYDYEVSKEFHDFCNAATPAAILELIALAERAVSPAESMQSVDTPEFLALLKTYRKDSNFMSQHDTDAYAILIAHIDAKIAAAHAEGRRSAMEELHPQWLKEKERADKAEADAAALWARRYSDALSASARQAPDLSKLARYEPVQVTPSGGANGVEFYRSMAVFPAGQWVSLSDVQALLSSAAQPLRQDGNVVASLIADIREAKSLARRDSLVEQLIAHLGAQPLQQEGGKDETGWLVEKTDEAGALLYRSMSDADGIYWTPDHMQAIRFARRVDAERFCEGDSEDVRVAEHMWHVSQPSDNLQQASTAQAEPATNNAEVAPSIVASATDAVECQKCDGQGATHYPDGEWEGKCAACEGTGIQQPAQATPEVADLPPLPWAKDGTNDIAGWIDARSEQEIAEEFESYARAALAATTAAEPVMYVRQCDMDGTRSGDMVMGYRTAGAEWIVPLYRAAPPQQVDTGGLPG